MRKALVIVIALIGVIACKHTILNQPASAVIIVGGGGTTNPSNDTVCFTNDVLPLFRVIVQVQVVTTLQQEQKGFN